MGRQTSVSLSEIDECNFLNFLRTTGTIRLMLPRAKEPRFDIATLPSRESRQTIFLIWNTAFPFEPRVEESEPQHDREVKEKFYIGNQAGAPLIEYIRDAYQNPSRGVYGRVYWNTDFALYHGPDYDHAAFGRWFDRVVRWLRKNSHRVEIAKGWSLYCLPDAWKLRQQLNKT
jgi:hypothetical protein